MSDMDRRAFLRGSLISIGASTALVKLATPEEAAALVVHQPTVIGQPGRHTYPGFEFRDLTMYMLKESEHRAEYVPVGYLTEIHMERMPIDVTSHWEGRVQFVPGLQRASGTFRGEA